VHIDNIAKLLFDLIKISKDDRIVYRTEHL